MDCVEQQKQLLSAVPASILVPEPEAEQETLGRALHERIVTEVIAVAPATEPSAPPVTNTHVHENIGEYIVRKLCVVNEDVSITGNIVGKLKPDTSVEVLEVIQCLANDRLRARIADPPGYISLRVLSDGSIAWATPAPAPLLSELRPAVGHYVITTATALNEHVSLEGRIVQILEPGTRVEVLKVLHRSKEQRIRAFLKEPRGYISLQQTEDVAEPFSWARPCLEVENRQARFHLHRSATSIQSTFQLRLPRSNLPVIHERTGRRAHPHMSCGQAGDQGRRKVVVGFSVASAQIKRRQEARKWESLKV